MGWQQSQAILKSSSPEVLRIFSIRALQLSSIVSSCQSHLFRNNSAWGLVFSLFASRAHRIVQTEEDCPIFSHTHTHTQKKKKERKKNSSKPVGRKKGTKVTGKEQYFLLHLGLAMLTNSILVGRNQQTRRHEKLHSILASGTYKEKAHSVSGSSCCFAFHT